MLFKVQVFLYIKFKIEIQNSVWAMSFVYKLRSFFLKSYLLPASAMNFEVESGHQCTGLNNPLVLLFIKSSLKFNLNFYLELECNRTHCFWKQGLE